MPVGKALHLLTEFAIRSAAQGDSINIDGEAFVKTDPQWIEIIGSDFSESVLHAMLPAAKKRGKIEVKVFPKNSTIPERELIFFSEARLNVDRQLHDLS